MKHRPSRMHLPRQGGITGEGTAKPDFAACGDGLYPGKDNFIFLEPTKSVQR
jgi:hypothetical protein